MKKIILVVILVLSLNVTAQNTIEITKRFDSVMCIPDGPRCDGTCLEASIFMEGFPDDAVVTDVNDIVSICIGIEHSFIGDLSFILKCPNGNRVCLKQFTFAGNFFLGYADTTEIGLCSCEPRGIGLTYCFSNQLLNDRAGIMNRNPQVNENIVVPTDTINQSHYFQTPYQGLRDALHPSEYYENMLDTMIFQNFIGSTFNGEWKLIVCDAWGQEDGNIFWWNITLKSNITGMNSIEQTNINIYPNPANDRLYIDGTNYDMIKIYNVLGEELISVGKTKEIDISNLNNGIYNVNVVSDNKIIRNKKIIKK